MKDYIKKQYSGNENGWKEPIKELSTHRMHEEQAQELNSHFGSTGVKYEEAKAEKPKEESKPAEEKKPATPKGKKAAEHKAE